jgi:hypothetical protein
MLHQGIEWLGNAILTPIHLFRRRIVIQLIVSYMVVVFLSALLIAIGALASLYGYLPSFLP